MNVIAICNQKGGTAKTTTAAAMAVLLSRQGQRVHVVDMDPQASLTSAFGHADSEGLLYEAMSKRSGLPFIRLGDNLTLTPSSIDLSRGETEFLATPGREYLLRTCLEKTALESSAIVILDCPPSLGVLAINCLSAASNLCVVVQPGGFELRALVHLQQTVDVLKERVNPTLAIIGAVLTNCHLRRAITEQVHAEVSRLYPILGQVRSDAQLLYTTTAGTLFRLTRSRALDDYGAVVHRLSEQMSWIQSG